MSEKIGTKITVTDSNKGVFGYCSGCEQRKQLKLCQTCHIDNDNFNGYCFFCRRHPAHNLFQCTEEQRSNDMKQWDNIL